MWRDLFRKLRSRPVLLGIGLPLWVLVGFLASNAITVGVFRGLIAVGVPLQQVNDALLNAAVGASIYALGIAIVVGLPAIVFKYRTSWAELGLGRSLLWRDLAFALLGFIAYIIIAALLLFIAPYFVPYDPNQVQEVGFSQLFWTYEYIAAFIALVVLAPVAEEILFRGYLLGKLRGLMRPWLAVLITSALFGVVHLAWNVGIDVFALSLVLCFLRLYTGSLWPAIILHMLKNGLAFVLLFINPTLLGTLGG